MRLWTKILTLEGALYTSIQDNFCSLHVGTREFSEMVRESGRDGRVVDMRALRISVAAGKWSVTEGESKRQPSVLGRRQKKSDGMAR